MMTSLNTALDLERQNERDDGGEALGMCWNVAVIVISTTIVIVQCVLYISEFTIVKEVLSAVYLSGILISLILFGITLLCSIRFCRGGSISFMLALRWKGFSLMMNITLLAYFIVNLVFHTTIAATSNDRYIPAFVGDICFIISLIFPLGIKLSIDATKQEQREELIAWKNVELIENAAVVKINIDVNNENYARLGDYIGRNYEQRNILKDVVENDIWKVSFKHPNCLLPPEVSNPINELNDRAALMLSAMRTYDCVPSSCSGPFHTLISLGGSICYLIAIWFINDDHVAGNILTTIAVSTYLLIYIVLLNFCSRKYRIVATACETALLAIVNVALCITTVDGLSRYKISLD